MLSIEFTINIHITIVYRIYGRNLFNLYCSLYLKGGILQAVCKSKISTIPRIRNVQRSMSASYKKSFIRFLHVWNG